VTPPQFVSSLDMCRGCQTSQQSSQRRVSDAAPHQPNSGKDTRTEVSSPGAEKVALSWSVNLRGKAARRSHAPSPTNRQSVADAGTFEAAVASPTATCSRYEPDERYDPSSLLAPHCQWMAPAVTGSSGPWLLPLLQLRALNTEILAHVLEILKEVRAVLHEAPNHAASTPFIGNRLSASSRRFMKTHRVHLCHLLSQFGGTFAVTGKEDCKSRTVSLVAWN